MLRVEKTTKCDKIKLIMNAINNSQLMALLVLIVNLVVVSALPPLIKLSLSFRQRLMSSRFSRSKLITASLLLVSAVVITTAQYLRTRFGNVSLDELQFYIFNDLTGANTGVFQAEIVAQIGRLLLIWLVLCLPLFNWWPRQLRFKLAKKQFPPVPGLKTRRMILGYGCGVFLLAMVTISSQLNALAYVKNISQKSTFFEQNYIDPSQVELIFPERPRNLIWIYLESMENTLASKRSGGVFEQSLIPELEALALDSRNTSFSSNSQLGGFADTSNSQWTVAALTALSSGVPLKTSASVGRNDFGNFNYFLPGAYSLGEILDQQNYNQLLMVGSDVRFGGRDKLFSQHGDYQIFDDLVARERGLIPEDYDIEWWGFEDRKLFEFAKTELTTLSEQDQPFNFQLLTVDTHFVDGWLDPQCAAKFDHKYKNVFACASEMVGEFVAWLERQPFYANTTVVITGDHLGMQTDFYDQAIGGDDYQRTVYNLFLNSPISTQQAQNRQFLAFDLYPTVLASLGVEIDGQRLGLGTNLFSDQPTLAERDGLRFVNQQLDLKSDFYNKNILTTNRQ